MNCQSLFNPAFLTGKVAEEILFKKITFTFGFLAILSSVTGIIGNISGIVLISSVCPGCKTISLSAALIWIFFGVILLCISSGKPLGRTVSLFLRAALVVIAGIMFLEIITGLYGGHFIIESWFIAVGSIIFGPLSSPISPVAAGLIIIAAIGLFFYVNPSFLSSQNRRTQEIIVAAGIIITLVSFTLILSYFYGNPFFYGTPGFPIAAISAIAAFCIGAGLIVAARPTTVPVCYFMGNSIRAMLLRNFVTLTVAVTFCENIFFYIISSWYDFSNEIILSISIVIFIIATALIVARISGEIGNRLDTAEHALVHHNEELSELNEELKSAEEELRQNVDDLTKTELALRESEERLIWHIDNSPLAVIAFDSQFRITFWSDEAYRMFGWTKEETIGKTLGEFRWVHDGDIERVAAISSDMMSGKSIRNMHSNRNFRKDGSVIDCEWYNSALRDNDGNLISIHSQVLDVTARKKTEAALRQSEQRFRLALRHAPVSVATQDRDLVFSWAYNQRTVRPEDIVGRKDTDIFNPADAAMLIELKRRVIETGSPLRQHCWLTMNGRQLFLEIYIEPLIGEMDEITGIGIATVDLTEQKLAQEALKGSEEHLRQARELLEAVTAGTEVIIAAVDRKFDYIFFNNAYKEEIQRLTGKDISIGFNMVELFKDLPEQQDVVVREWSRALKGEKTSTDLEFGDSDRYRRMYHVLHTPLHDEEGLVIGAGEVAIDITRQVKTESALRENERFLNETEKIAKLGGWTANPHTDYLRWTEGIYSIVEAPHDYLLGFSDGMKYFSEEDRDLIRNRIETCLITGEPFTLEVMITTETGKKVWTELRGLMPIMAGDHAFVTGTLQDVTDRRLYEERLNKKSEKLDILADTARLLMSSEKPENIVRIAGERVMQYLNCHTFFNYLIDENEQRMHLNAYAGITNDDAQMIEYLDLGKAVCGQVARDGERVVLFDILKSEDERTSIIRSFGISGYVCHPLIYQDRILGTLSFGTRDLAHFSQEDLDLVRSVTDLVATAMARKKIEDTLRGTSQYLENLIDYANAPIIVWDTEFKILRFNHAFEFLTGMAADTVLKKSLDILFPKKTRHETMEMIRKTSRGEQWDSVEIPIQHVSGAIKIVLWNSANLYDTDGVTITSTIAQGNDITERKRAEETSIKTASLLNAALDSTADGILVVDIDRNITGYNKTFCEIWGIPEHRLDSAGEKTALAYMTPLIADSPEFVARLKDFYAHPERESYDIVSLTDGRIFERYSKPQKISETIVGRVWSYRDITERRRVEEALRESLEKFRIIATNTPDHIIVQDKNLRYVQVINPQLGLTVQEMIGKTDYEFLSKEDADNLTKIKRQVIESGTPVHQEIPLVNTQCEKNYFAGSYIPKRNAAGEIDGLIGYFRNITESKQANEKIIAALAEKETLIREIHHRVKNNLQIISSLLSMTRTRTQDPAVSSILTDMMMKIKTMAQIHTRLYESKQFDKINVSSHIQDQVTDLLNIYRKSGPEITCTVEAEELYLPVDQAIPCALVINEALSNAFKHAFKGRERGTIRVSLRQDGKNITMNIEDDGVGIPVDVDIQRSMSLGLKLIRNLVLQLEGTVKIENTTHGSLVNVCFPIR